MLSIWSSLETCDLDELGDLPDPRTGNAQRHNLLDVLTIALTATICGAESCVEFADFARDREALFRDFLELPGGLPSHNTFSRLLRLLDPVAFAARLAQFLHGLGEAGLGVIATDGKTMRRSFDRAAGRSALHVVTAFATDTGEGSHRGADTLPTVAHDRRCICTMGGDWSLTGYPHSSMRPSLRSQIRFLSIIQQRISHYDFDNLVRDARQARPSTWS